MENSSQIDVPLTYSAFKENILDQQGYGKNKTQEGVRAKNAEICCIATTCLVFPPLGLCCCILAMDDDDVSATESWALAKINLALEKIDKDSPLDIQTLGYLSQVYRKTILGEMIPRLNGEQMEALHCLVGPTKFSKILRECPDPVIQIFWKMLQSLRKDPKNSPQKVVNSLEEIQLRYKKHPYLVKILFSELMNSETNKPEIQNKLAAIFKNLFPNESYEELPPGRISAYNPLVQVEGYIKVQVQEKTYWADPRVLVKHSEHFSTVLSEGYSNEIMVNAEPIDAALLLSWLHRENFEKIRELPLGKLRALYPVAHACGISSVEGYILNRLRKKLPPAIHTIEELIQAIQEFPTAYLLHAELLEKKKDLVSWDKNSWSSLNQLLKLSKEYNSAIWTQFESKIKKLMRRCNENRFFEKLVLEPKSSNIYNFWLKNLEEQRIYRDIPDAYLEKMYDYAVSLDSGPLKSHIEARMVRIANRVNFENEDMFSSESTFRIICENSKSKNFQELLNSIIQELADKTIWEIWPEPGTVPKWVCVNAPATVPCKPVKNEVPVFDESNDHVSPNIVYA